MALVRVSEVKTAPEDELVDAETLRGEQELLDAMEAANAANLHLKMIHDLEVEREKLEKEQDNATRWLERRGKQITERLEEIAQKIGGIQRERAAHVRNTVIKKHQQRKRMQEEERKAMHSARDAVMKAAEEAARKAALERKQQLQQEMYALRMGEERAKVQLATEEVGKARTPEEARKKVKREQ
jgi:hypothetical protein